MAWRIYHLASTVHLFNFRVILTHTYKSYALCNTRLVFVLLSAMKCSTAPCNSDLPWCKEYACNMLIRSYEYNQSSNYWSSIFMYYHILWQVRYLYVMIYNQSAIDQAWMWFRSQIVLNTVQQLYCITKVNIVNTYMHTSRFVIVISIFAFNIYHNMHWLIIMPYAVMLQLYCIVWDNL